MSISEVLLCLFLIGLQIFVSLRLLGREAVWWKVMSFTLLQTSSIALFTYILPNPALQFLAISITHFVYFMWVFSADLFHDTLACYLTPFAFAALGELLLRHLFQDSGRFHLPNVIIKTFVPPFGLWVYLPLLFFALYFLIKDYMARKNDDDQRRPIELNSVDCLIACAIIALCCYLRSPTLNINTDTESCFRNLFLGGSLFTLPLVLFAVHQYITKEIQTGKSLQYHVKQHAVQKLAIKVLREERHEFINELTLISTYLQMGKIKEAITCIDYSSAKLADRNNYASLPHDAWLTVLELKQTEAKNRQIHFQVDIQAAAPRSFKEQRLLPKIIINLVDNAFNAVAGRSNPQVTLTWSFGPAGERILAVVNNGPEISPWDGKMMFRGGVTTKKDASGNHGWGLVICRDIARELEGSLSYHSSPEETAFVLILPPLNEHAYEQLVAT